MPPPRVRERLARTAWVVLGACGIAACTLDTEGQFAAGTDSAFNDAGTGGTTGDAAVGTGGTSHVGGAAGWPSGGSGGVDAGSAGAGAVAGTGGAAGVAGTSGAAGDAGGNCGPSEKRCGQDCVSLDDPATGCAASNCDPCVFPHADAVCNAGACALGACKPLWGNCNQTVADGCELDLSSDLANCGACGQTCESPAATAACIAGKCSLQCVDGFADCDGNLSNGCEIDAKYDPNNCGACGHVCTGGFNCMVSHCGCAANSANCGASSGANNVVCEQLSGADKCRCNGQLCEYGQRCSDSAQCID